MMTTIMSTCEPIFTEANPKCGRFPIDVAQRFMLKVYVSANVPGSDSSSVSTVLLSAKLQKSFRGNVVSSFIDFISGYAI